MSNGNDTNGGGLRPLDDQRQCDPGTDVRKEQAKEYRTSEANRACVRDPDSLKNRNNGEEDELRNPTTGELSYAANFTKGMPLHPDADAEELGEVDPEAYERMLGAVNSESPGDFGGIPLGGDRRFVDPQNGLTFDLQGPDAPSTVVYDRDLEPRSYLNAPRFDSDWFAAEMAETYWMAILRDKHVSLFQSNTEDDDIRIAADNLSQFRDYRGPRSQSGPVSGQELFRGGNVNAHEGPTPIDPDGRLDGSTIGPLVSQLQLIGSRIDEGNGLTNQFFASRVIPPDTSTGLSLKRSDGLVTFGTLVIDQKQWEIKNELDFMGGYNEWLAIQRGDLPTAKNEFTGERRFLYNLRQLANYVHFDITYQPVLVAAVLLLSMQERAERIGIDLFDPGNPYLQPGAANQEGFGMFGNGHVLRSVGEAATRGLQAVWNGKFFNQRRLRPEAAAGRITNILRGLATRERYGFPSPPEVSELFDSDHGKAVLQAILEFNEDQGHEFHLLPQGYPEGSPLHPAYPAGHAAMIGAGVTVIKAHFNEDFPITDGLTVPDGDHALVPNIDGSKLVEYEGPDENESLLLGRESNKLASNISLARNMAGVHFRVDYSESIQIGEYAALGMLQEQARSFNPEHSFTLTLFNGRKVKIKSGGEIEVLG